MLDTSPEHMLQEIQVAETDRDRHLPFYNDMVEQYHGDGYTAVDARNRSLANHNLEWITLVNPRIAQDNPKVLVSTPSGNRNNSIVAVALQHAGQKWIDDTSLSRHLIHAVLDFSFAWTIAYVEHREGNVD